MITFPVSDVHPTHTRLSSTSVAESLRARTRRGFEATACNLPDLVESSSDHGLLDAVHLAFAYHLPLILSPDDIWICIAQGFAAHVNRHAEELRERFVRHQGKKRLEVRRNSFVRGSPDNDWPGMFAELSDKLSKHLGKTRDLVVANFSTTGPVEKAVSEVVLFDAFQTYFEYGLCTTCGIPQITLLGTPDDWLAIRRRVEVFTEFELGPWVQALLPILDQFVASAHGKPERTFWQSLYKFMGGSGTSFVSGWINVLFPYLKRHENPLALEDFTSLRHEAYDRFYSNSLDDFPTGISSAPFAWSYYGKEVTMTFMGGFVGVAQDQASGAVRPALGWAIGEQQATQTSHFF